jgi:geranylgeranyl pyrophosphate synthase
MKIDVEKILQESAIKIDKMIERYIPRKYEKKSIVFSVNPPLYDCDLGALNKALASPIWDFLDRGGKRWRPALFLLIVEALGKEPSEFLEFAIIPEIIHNGTIMMDDIEDRSEFRRGKPCTHKLFGIDVAINTANSMYYMPFLSLIKNRNKLSAEKLSKIYEIYFQEMISLSLGQATDIAWHKGWIETDNVTENQYLQMCAYKTGTLARMAAKIAAVLCEASNDNIEQLGKFAETIGIAFQIQDDILDLTGENFAEKKGGKGQDITEGKRSLIVIHAFRNAGSSDKKRLMKILNMHTTDQKLIEDAIQIMEKNGSINYAKQYAQNIVRESWNDMDKLLSLSEAKNKLKAFTDYLIERTI